MKRIAEFYNKIKLENEGADIKTSFICHPPWLTVIFKFNGKMKYIHIMLYETKKG